MADALSKRIRAFADEIPAKGNRLKIGFAREFLTEVIPSTPVESGKARSNWLVGLVQRNRSTREALDKSGDAALQQGLAQINNAEPGETIHISNNLPYIGQLNSGSSKQAPAGFVEKAYATAKTLMPRIKEAVAGGRSNV